MPRTTLTPKQQRFVDVYLLSLNATHAYREAGYRGTGNVAEAAASRLLRNVKVAAAIETAQAARAARVQLTQDAVLEEIALLTHSDVRHYVIDDRGDVALRDGAPAAAMRAVASLKKKVTHTDYGITYETEIRLWNKPASVRMAGEHLGTFKPASTELPALHVHIHEARNRLAARLEHLAKRHAEDATNGH